MSQPRRGSRVTVIEMTAVPSGWRAGLHQIAREVTTWTDPLLTLFFDKQRLRAELERTQEMDLVRERLPLEAPPLDTRSPEHRVEDAWPGDHWPVERPRESRENRAERAELPPQLDDWDNEGARTNWEGEWPTR
ncbi:MAG: hypothetical protein KF708_16920 [Pirellulales bacterium]|nr:hypothetical protein [Pirellulales bacterium]